MKKKEWGPLIWNFLHTLSVKIKEESFESQKKNLLDIFRMIISTLPCPYCSQHALSLFKNANKRFIVDKISFIDFIYVFHNQVNRKLKKESYPKDFIIKKYEKNDLLRCLDDLKNVYNYKSNNLRLMLVNNGNKQILNKVAKKILDNKEHYHLYKEEDNEEKVENNEEKVEE